MVSGPGMAMLRESADRVYSSSTAPKDSHLPGSDVTHPSTSTSTHTSKKPSPAMTPFLEFSSAAQHDAVQHNTIDRDNPKQMLTTAAKSRTASITYTSPHPLFFPPKAASPKRSEKREARSDKPCSYSCSCSCSQLNLKPNLNIKDERLNTKSQLHGRLI